MSGSGRSHTRYRIHCGTQCGEKQLTLKKGAERCEEGEEVEYRLQNSDWQDTFRGTLEAQAMSFLIRRQGWWGRYLLVVMGVESRALPVLGRAILLSHTSISHIWFNNWIHNHRLSLKKSPPCLCSWVILNKLKINKISSKDVHSSENRKMFPCLLPTLANPGRMLY